MDVCRPCFSLYRSVSLSTLPNLSLGLSLPPSCYFLASVCSKNSLFPHISLPLSISLCLSLYLSLQLLISLSLFSISPSLFLCIFLLLLTFFLLISSSLFLPPNFQLDLSLFFSPPPSFAHSLSLPLCFSFLPSLSL